MTQSNSIPEEGTLEWAALEHLFNANMGPAIDLPRHHPARALSRAEMRRITHAHEMSGKPFAPRQHEISVSSDRVRNLDPPTES